MKKFLVYLLVIILTISIGFAIFYLVRDNEVISISNVSIYKDAGESFTLDINHRNKKSYTEISVTSSDDNIVKGEYDSKNGQFKATAVSGGVARINIRTSNAKFRNLWCDVIVGDGTVESPYYISTAEQLASIGMGVQTDDGSGVYKGSTIYKPEYEKYTSNACYKLVSDIDVSTINNGYWVPLQNFNGRFDGNGLTISNVYIDAVGYKNSITNPDVRFDSNKPAGLFASIGNNGIVYSFKVSNYSAIGTYSNFGVITADNYGTIERVEVKDAYCSVKSAVFGGIAGRNISDEREVVIIDENNIEKQTFERTIARIDRTSVNKLTLGEVTTIDPSGNSITSIQGVSGTVGGLVGVNNGGKLLYSYVRGAVYFNNDYSSIYGGVVGQNYTKSSLHFDSEDKTESEFEFAGIRDCYADINTYFTNSSIDSHIIGGAIGINQDYQNGLFENDATKLRVNNYIVGVYYNKDTLNNSNDGITKNFKGIGKFLLDEKTVSFSDSEYIVWGLTQAEMTQPENFVSHTTMEIHFNEDGTSKGVVQTNVLWLFDSVWAISYDTNDGMPYLNYQLSYIPDDFQTLGVPVVTSALDNYYYENETDYPVTIISGTDGKVRMKVEEYYQLVYSPTGIDITWESGDSSIVSVDNNGKLYGKKAGVTNVTATTKTGSKAYVTVIVENIPYSITAPSTLYMYQGEIYSLNNFTISPALIGNDTISYSIKDNNGNSTNLVWIDGTNLCASPSSIGTVKLTISVADTSLTIDVVVVEIAEVKLTASTKTITGYLSDMTRTGTITIENDKNFDLSYNYNFISGASIVDITFENNDSSKLNYAIKGVGTATVRVGIATQGFENKGSVDIFFNIMADKTVSLTASPSTINGYFSSIKKSGSATIKNSEGTTLQYNATSSNTNVVTVLMDGNSMNYTIQGVGSATVTISVTTSHYKGVGYVYFNIQKDPENNDDTPIPSENIKLSKTSITIDKGKGYTLKASGTYTNLTWTTTNSAIASVNSNGYVYGVSVGTATIIAKSDYAEARCVVYVEKAETEVTKISICPTSLTLSVGDKYELSASGNYSTVSWKSDNSNIVTVDSEGAVTALAVGTAKITASAKDSKGVVRATATCTITVINPVVITLLPTSTICFVGDVVFVGADVNQNIIVSWSYDNTLADFSENGNNLTISTTKATTIEVTARYGSTIACVVITVNPKNTYTPYIYNKDQLNAVRNNPDKMYYLAATFTVGDWTPIDNFTGTLTTIDNATYTLKGIKVSGVSYAGLFGQGFKGTINNITIDGAKISGTYAGGIVASSKGGKIRNSKVKNSTITGSQYAGGVAGLIESSSVISKCTVTSNTVVTTTTTSFVGGIVGKATSSSVEKCYVYGGSAKMGSSAHGYAGGIAGYLSYTRAYDCLVGRDNGSVTITANSEDGDYAGGICGYTDGTGNGSKQGVSACTIKYATITGYHAGGISGAMTSTRTIKLLFKETESGYRFQDLSSYSYTSNIDKTAVRENVTIKGSLAGGLVGVINSGVVENCYSRAKIYGLSSKSVKGGFAARIYASRAFDNNGGTGTCGLVIYCYSVCSFEGSGLNYSITASLVHNYATIGNGSDRAGYCMNYLFDNDEDGKATYKDGSNLFSSDKVKAKKSSSDMQKSATYTDKGFSSTYWNLAGYPTLKTEK